MGNWRSRKQPNAYIFHLAYMGSIIQPQQRKEQSPDVTSSASTVFSISRRKNVPVDVERGCILKGV